MFFRELMPLIEKRPLTITVVADGHSNLKVNIIPQTIDKDQEANKKITHVHSKEVAEIPKPAIQALTTPLCLTGTPEELDAGLSKTLTEFTSAHASLQQSFDTAAAAIREAVKQIDDRERIKKEQAKKNGTAANKGGSPTEQKKAAPEPGLPSLFTAPAAVSANDAPSSTPAATQAEAETEEEEESGQGGESC
jgi:PRTRC genetic system protein E